MQIVDYVEGRQQVIKHVGPAHTEAEPGVLWARAEELMVDPAQQVLDIEVEAATGCPVSPPAALATLFDVDVDGGRGPNRMCRGRPGAGHRFAGCCFRCWPGCMLIWGLMP